MIKSQQREVRDVMSSPAITIGPDASFPEIVDVMLTHEISGLPVVDAGGQLLGVVTEADLVSKEAYGFHRRRPLALVREYLLGRDPQWVRKAAGCTAADLMTAAPSSASPDDELRTVARTMIERHHKRLPVVRNGVVVGVISRHDLLQEFHRHDEDILADVNALLTDLTRVPEHQARAFVLRGVVTLIGDVRNTADAAVLGDVVAQVMGVVAVDNRCRPEGVLAANAEHAHSERLPNRAA